jgi:hypothetical protein
MGQMALDALYDSLKVFGFAFVIYVLLSFFEGKIAQLLEKRGRLAPAFGALCGTIPQCGISVVGSDLYIKRHLTLGTLLAIFIACSDEALPVLFGDVTGKWYVGFIVVAIKVVAGTIIGFLVDLIPTKDRKEVAEHMEHCEGEKSVHYGCCGHEIEEEHESPWHEHLLHPLWHSFKIFVFAFAVSFFFGWIVIAVGGQDVFNNFLSSNYYLSPLFSVAVGLIPNCVSSVMISELYIQGGLPFGALIAGLAVNAGLGPLYLFRKGTIKEAFMIMGILIVLSLALGYAFIWVKI